MINYAFCSASIAPLRTEADDASEMVSQLLFGEPIEIIEEQNQWRKIRSLSDNYEGWTDFKLLTVLREKEMNRWLDGLGAYKSFTGIIEGEFGRQFICRGAFVPESTANEFNIGSNLFRLKEIDAFNISKDRVQTTIDLAIDYLNVPYLWGGKSTAGIDCSGLIQSIFRCVDVKLPRDAYEQEEYGQDIEWDDRSAGDLVYFINANQNVHHVGILINENEIIHAHGFVRIDDLIKEGIRRRTDGLLSHKFHSIKRI